MSDINDIRNDAYLNETITGNVLSDAFVREHLPTLKRVLASRALCEGCRGMEECRQRKAGERLALSFDQVLIEEIERCPYGSQAHLTDELADRYVYCDVPKNLMHLDIKNIVPRPEQQALFTKLYNIYEGKRNKGLYISGNVGTGKSYNCTALANSLVKCGKRVAYVKAASFFSDLKNQYINTSDGIDRTVNRIRNAEYLFLDDLGTETVSEFVRDDVLFRILDYRMENALTTVFISNLDKNSLFKHYQYDRRDNTNTMNATRLMERINILSDDYALTGKDLREEYNA